VSQAAPSQAPSHLAGRPVDPSGVWTPHTVLTLLARRLAATDPEARALLRLRGVPVRVSRAYAGRVYVRLQDPHVPQDAIALELSTDLAARLEAGREVTVVGLLDYRVTSDSVRPTVLVADIEGLGARLRPTPGELAARWQKARVKRDPIAALRAQRPRVAVVTAETGTALEDIRAQLLETEGRIDLVSCQVPITDPEAVARGIARAARDADLVILARGGGEGLDVLDDERVLQAVAACPVPIVAALGHAADRLAAALVADHACETPTAAGVWLRSVLRETTAERTRAAQAEEVRRAGDLARAVDGLRREAERLRGELARERVRARLLAVLAAALAAAALWLLLR
jgi:exodeoxyribonuclease VII large subunit